MIRHLFCLVVFYLLSIHCFSQNKYEREQRILRHQFPEKALNYLSKEIEGAKRIRFYKEMDSIKISFEAKFKKERLWYSVEFDKEGELEDVEINIEETDIPKASWENINIYLNNTFIKKRIKKIQQQYPSSREESTALTLKNAFQNLLLPSIRYEIIVSGKKEKVY
ncbi:MAG: hypothetical protein AAFO99_11520, partial [Bacteroidota bacterium]